MFENKYTTRGVAIDVNLDIQLALWGMIDKWKSQGKELDYLQVFNLSIECAMGKMYQKIEHRQEQPPLKQEAFFNVYKPMSGTVWIVDDGEHAVMMKPAEY